MKCEICESELYFSWTDTHGVAQCCNCGTPYRIFHYDEGKRVEKPPELQVKTEYIETLREYHKETGCLIPSGFSFPGGQELARERDRQAFSDWMKLHPIS